MSIAPEAARLSTLLLRQLADLVAGLNEHQVGELLAGRTRLTLTAAQDGRAARPAPQAKAALPAAVDVEVLRTALLGATSREEAAERLAALGRVSVPQLRALAGALGVDGVGGKDPKASVIRKIVDGTVGFRLSSQAMLSEETDL
ncbi:hypothetical protein [Candidatus Frankia alpina]|uniref:Rho termination factor N-terminal domain-containing protein n=1 Tax=Candidatus Frankia alpina TaxID=2699483 RepID=A0A4S5ERX3_9ACTN|nr:hypothetical protein [Candidatus Frankia alpina]THJ74882.1 hypothetical protein E7Y31_08790 [Candidatus Frankia alpina]